MSSELKIVAAGAVAITCWLIAAYGLLCMFASPHPAVKCAAAVPAMALGFAAIRSL